MDRKKNQFIVLTTTYKRNDLLLRAIESVKQQTYSHWKMLIINDSPEDLLYEKIEKNLQNSNDKIIYIKNDKNYGKNFSLNKVLYSITEKEDSYIIFLDDDDWLDSKALETATSQIQSNLDFDWFVSNRATKNGIKITKIKKLSRYSYTKDFLITKNISGDATHIVKLKIAKKAFFSKRIKNGEEWFYFSQIKPNNFKYYNFNSTYSDGYNSKGLTNSISSFKILRNSFPLFLEAISIKTISPFYNFSILLYFFGRIIKATIKSIF